MKNNYVTQIIRFIFSVFSWLLVISVPLVMLLLIYASSASSRERPYYYCNDVFCHMSIAPFAVLFAIISIIFLVGSGGIIREFKQKKKRYISYVMYIVVGIVAVIIEHHNYGTVIQKREEINNQLIIVGKEIHSVCTIRQRCPLSLDGKRFKRVKAGAHFTELDSSDEIAENLYNKIGVGYNKEGITYKMKPWHGLIAFNYKATNRKFKLSYMSDHDDLVTIEISGGIGSKLTLNNFCTACGGREKTSHTIK